MFLLAQTLIGLALPDFPALQLPYLLLTDDDLRRLPIPSLQPTWGLLALWVTGRAMELARELFALWGYRRIDEVVWVKTGQLGGLVRTGRTGHWLKQVFVHLHYLLLRAAYGH